MWRAGHWPEDQAKVCDLCSTFFNQETCGYAEFFFAIFPHAGGVFLAGISYKIILLLATAYGELGCQNKLTCM